MDTLSWSALTTKPPATQTLDWLSEVSLVVFGIVFLVVSALVLWPRTLGLRRRIGRNSFGRWVSVGLWLSSLGLIFLILRFLQIDPMTLSRPIWLLGVLIGIACWMGWLAVMVIASPPIANVPAGYAPTIRRPRRSGKYR